ncbi:hypothetical protein HD554DRAFT_2036698 [Boletus coccyginus]|nr:hypothetical protein HD554DRAFT_2036698 [Boletus coccyginus]
MPSSSSTKKTEEVLEKVLPTTREESEDPSPVLCETDENNIVKEERFDGCLCGRKDDADKDPSTLTLRAQLEDIRIDSDLLSSLSPQAEKCLRETQDTNAKLRTRLTEQSNPPPPSINEQGSDLNLICAGTTETSTGLSPADDTPEQAGEKMKFPRNKPCSVSEVSEPNANPAITNDQDCTPDVNTLLETLSESGDRICDPSIRRHRRSPPPPPPRRMAQSGNSSETSCQSSDSPRHSQSVRRPAPPPPRSPLRQPSTPRSSTNTSIPGTSLPDPATTSAISRLAQQLASSAVVGGLSGSVTKTNCVDINGSNVYGLTMNNGGTKNSGANFTER